VVGNYAARFYSFAMQSVRALQHQLEAEMFAGVAAVEEKVLDMLAQVARE